MQYPHDTCTCQCAHLTNQHFRQHYTNNHVNLYILWQTLIHTQFIYLKSNLLVLKGLVNWYHKLTRWLQLVITKRTNTLNNYLYYLHLMFNNIFCIQLLCNRCALYQITWIVLLVAAQFFQKSSLWGLLMGSDMHN